MYVLKKIKTNKRIKTHFEISNILLLYSEI